MSNSDVTRDPAADTRSSVDQIVSSVDRVISSVVGDIVGGDFVGRDKDIFLGSNQVSITGNVYGNVYISQNPTRDRMGIQIERLRGRITRLIPVEEGLLQLSNLREPKLIGRSFHLNEIELSALFISTRWTMDRAKKDNNSNDTTQKYLIRLNTIEAELTPDVKPEQLSGLLQSLSDIADEVNIHIARLNSLFTSLVYPSTSSRELFENMTSKIGHKEFQEEANMHLGVIRRLVERLDLEKLTVPDFDVLSDEASGAIGVMTEMEKRRLLVEKLVRSDRGRRNWTMFSVIFYICIATGLTTFLIFQWGTFFNTDQTQLSQLRLPLIGVPWPVIVWSLIGSFAAMIHRFNASPIYNFSDTLKWMLTRPVQGVVLGAAFYLILISGLFVLTGKNISSTDTSSVSDNLILVLCFLVGFSDKFANSVLNTLVQRYSSEVKE